MRVIAYPNRHYPPADDALALADTVVSGLADVAPRLLAVVARESRAPTTT
jgi:hypothetical protein